LTNESASPWKPGAASSVAANRQDETKTRARRGPTRIGRYQILPQPVARLPKAGAEELAQNPLHASPFATVLGRQAARRFRVRLPSSGGIAYSAAWATPLTGRIQVASRQHCGTQTDRHRCPAH